MGLCAVLLATPAAAAVNLGLPFATQVNFDGNGVFALSNPFVFETIPAVGTVPVAMPVGTEFFGAGTISDLSPIDASGVYMWLPIDEGPDFEMTYTFFDAVVTSSGRWIADFNGDATFDVVLLTARYADSARLLVVQDGSEDFSPAPGPGLFDLGDGEYPGSYTLEGAGSGDFDVADDPDEEVFLDLTLSGNSSAFFYNIATGQFSASFSCQSVEILGGSGASQFTEFAGSDGEENGFVFRFSPTGWAFGGDTDIRLTTVIPEPATLVFLATGLAGLVGYRLRSRMSA